MSKKQEGHERKPRKTGRYTLAEKAEILKQAAGGRSAAEVARQYGCSEWSIYRWRKLHPELAVPEETLRRPMGRSSAEEKVETVRRIEGGESVPEVAAELGVSSKTLVRWCEKVAGMGSAEEKVKALEPGSSRPNRIETPAQDRVKRLVLETKEEHGAFGPAQIQAYLRRFHGLAVSVKVVARILKEAGYELQKRAAKEPEAPQRFEMTRPNELWQIDVLEFRIIEKKVYLLHILDDFSRFSVGHRLLESVSSSDAIDLVDASTRRHGKPEAMLSDRGPQFSAFRGMTEFEKYLEGQEINHVKARAYHPQTIGKLEALNRAIREEVLDWQEFRTVAEARQRLSRWFRIYNFERPHLGIGGLVPADRYHGREEEVREEIARAIAAGGGDLAAGGTYSVDRASRLDTLVLQLRLVEGALELWFAGKKVRLA